MLDQPSSPQTTNLWALLVGIDEYKAPEINRLRGCVNDVQAMHVMLIDHLKVPDAHIKVLTNKEATHEAIISAFEGFLIDNPEILAGSQILFHCSCHGSQMPSTSASEPDGLDETIVPYDSRTPGLYDISDKTLAGLIARLAATKGNNISIILDCCHSGSGTRAALSGTRRIAADHRIPPANLDARLRLQSVTRSISPSGWTASQNNHVLLAACLDSQEACEHRVTPEITHGALTYFTLEYLRQMPPGATYADLCDWVATQFTGIHLNQTPQCEGQRDRQIFGGATVTREPFILVRECRGTEITLAAGLVHGLTVGAEVSLYPPSGEGGTECLAKAEVFSVTATSATAKIVGEPKMPLTPPMRARVTGQSYSGSRELLSFASVRSTRDQALLSQVKELAGKSPYLQTSDGKGNLVVEVENNLISILDQSGASLIIPVSQPLEALSALESISRFRAIRSFSNTDPLSKLAGQVKLRLRRYVAGAKATDMPAIQKSDDGELTLYFDEADLTRNRYLVEVRNDSPQEVFAHVFYLDPEFGITQFYPDRGQQEKIAPKSTFYLGMPGAGGPLLDIYLPDEPRWESSRDGLKLIVTTEAADLGILAQAPLKVPAQRAITTGGPLSQLLQAVAFGSGKRGGRPVWTAGEDWTTAELSFRITRASIVCDLKVGATEVSLRDDLKLRKPQDFAGQITVNTVEHTTRGTSAGSGVRPPPALAALPEMFQPVQRAGTRSLGSAGVVLDLYVDESSRKSVDASHPLLLTLPAEATADSEDLLPIAFDGEDYLLIGHTNGRPGEIAITHLPEPVARTRGTFNTIKVFLYKKLGRYVPQLGLHTTRLEGDKVIYDDVNAAAFKKKQAVAVLVHGFNSDTKWMVAKLSPWLLTDVLAYDHLLTFDYESFGDNIAASGEALALALRKQCGFTADDDITVHVFAHSMGSLVSRCMIELFGGNEFVDRLVVAGPPNRGTTLATSTRGLLYVFNVLLNSLDKVPVLGSLNWVSKQIYEAGKGWSDLTVDSEITKQLNALDRPSNVPYLVLAGENQPDENQLARLQRLAHKVVDKSLDALFGEQNDKVVGRSSMHGLRLGNYPNLRIEVVACDHFAYYEDLVCQTHIKQWLIGESTSYKQSASR